MIQICEVTHTRWRQTNYFSYSYIPHSIYYLRVLYYKPYVREVVDLYSPINGSICGFKFYNPTFGDYSNETPEIIVNNSESTKWLTKDDIDYNNLYMDVNWTDKIVKYYSKGNLLYSENLKNDYTKDIVWRIYMEDRGEGGAITVAVDLYRDYYRIIQDKQYTYGFPNE